LTHERFDRTYKYDQDLEAMVAGLTPERIASVFRKRIDPAAMVFVNAGDFEKARVTQ
jgi:predicted Zn-dependent peptidase